MWSRFRFVLLPAFGAIAAMAAFQIAAPFEGTLDRPGLSLLAPEAQFTYGTRWGDVNRLAFGAILCGLFCLGLSFGRRGLFRVLFCGALGTVLGGLVNYVTDSSADIVGLTIARKAGFLGNIFASIAWCVLVPAGISLAILLAIGPTRQRFQRACVGSMWAAVASFVAQIIGSSVGGRHLTHQIVGSLVANMSGGGSGPSLQAFLPVWRSQEIAVGVALGLAMALADSQIRAGTLRLVLGRNEWREWSLDHSINRIGSAEGVEIPLGNVAGVERVHALVVRQGPRFILDTQGCLVQVNGQAVMQADLRHGDTIQMGAATLQFLEGGVLASAPHLSASRPPAPQALVPLGVLIDAAGGQYHLPIGQYGVGREADNAICLSKEASVSRYHARILVTVYGTQLTDMGSTNGTLVNGNRVVGETALQPGDKLQFGHVQFTVGSPGF